MANTKPSGLAWNAILASKPYDSLEREVLFLHNLCHVRGVKKSNTPRVKEEKRCEEQALWAKKRLSSMNDRGKSHTPNIEVVLVLVFVCSTCAAEEFRDFMLCSNNLSSSSTLRASLLVGAPYARKPQSFKPQTACKYGQHIQKEHRTHCSNGDKSNTMCINA